MFRKTNEPNSQKASFLKGLLQSNFTRILVRFCSSCCSFPKIAGHLFTTGTSVEKFHAFLKPKKLSRLVQELLILECTFTGNKLNLGIENC